MNLAFALLAKGQKIRWLSSALLFSSTRVVLNASTLPFPFFDPGQVHVDVFCALSDISAAEVSRPMKRRAPQTQVFLWAVTLDVRSHASRNGKSRADYFWAF